MGDASGLMGAICLMVLFVAGAVSRGQGRLRNLKRENISLMAYVQILEARNAALLDGLKAAAEAADRTEHERYADEMPDEEFMGWEAPRADPPPDPRILAREILGLRPDEALTPERLKSAYRDAVKKAHPDNGGDAGTFMAVRDAYDLLGGRV